MKKNTGSNSAWRKADKTAEQVQAKVEEKEEAPNPLLAWAVEEEQNLVVMETEESRVEE